MKKAVLLSLFLSAVSLFGDNSLEPLDKLAKAQVKSYRSSALMKLPVITWGADLVTVHANGDKVRTASGSFFQQQGLNFELFREDDFVKQVEMYLSGETVFLRGTMGMIHAAAAITEKDSRTQQVVIYQHSWSAGGDALVVKPGIKNVADLKGKTVAIQKFGPHVDYLVKILADAGLSLSDITIMWAADLVGPEGNTPMAKFYNKNVDAAFVITPDALALTSSGTVGTGAEESVKGARIMMSTKTANRIISDVYSVRKDYYDANRDRVEKFVKALLLAEEEVKTLYKSKNKAYRSMLSAGAGIILDSTSATADMEAMAYLDAELAAYDGNVDFFTDSANLRNFERVSQEIQDSFTSLGLLSSRVTLIKGDLNYKKLSEGLQFANKAKVSRFDQDVVTQTVAKMRQQDTIDSSALFELEIFFKPNQNSFTADLYKEQFDKIISLAAAYGGAVITVEGHSDPMGFLRKQKEGASSVELNRIKQAAKNLSYSRANAVRDEIIAYAASQGILLDPNQFAVSGYGISQPKFPVPKTEQQWKDNMRVEFKIIQIEAEEDAFVPLF